MHSSYMCKVLDNHGISLRWEVPVHWSTAILGARWSKTWTGVKTARTPWQGGDSIKVGAWQTYLTNHPDKFFVDYLLRRIVLGFIIGCKSQASQMTSSKPNLVSAIQHPQMVSECIKKEVQANHMHLVRTTQDDLARKIHRSLFGVCCNV